MKSLLYIEDGNVTSSFSKTQGVDYRNSIQGDGGDIDTCLIYMVLLVIILSCWPDGDGDGEGQEQE
jgi:hypothetical protein